MRKIALITGASAGIGTATAEILAENGYNLIVTGRRKGLLDKLKSELGVKFKSDVLVLNFDIRDRAQTEAAIDSLPKSWKNVDVLINNAGLAAGLAPIQEGSADDWDQMIDTNIRGLLYITRKVAPLMVKRGYGHIVNITSIAAKEVYENGNVYCATKHAVDALTRGMRIDLVKHGVKVTSIAPGMVNTEFSLVRFKGDKARADKVYEGLAPLSADDVAEAVWFALSRPAHVNINDMLLMPTAQANITTTVRKQNLSQTETS
ncbi:MAG: SDR family NAD(P)-dependent oxidoreductase [Bacteroidales bacterium]|jgi:NADP-dependent 3-hydroxy acid dehydrogenase YdfG|nr:SDR family NAD(P)-dependent oxidoreductase [Bacteroidales bacterium]